MANFVDRLNTLPTAPAVEDMISAGRVLLGPGSSQHALVRAALAGLDRGRAVFALLDALHLRVEAGIKLLKELECLYEGDGKEAAMAVSLLVVAYDVESVGAAGASLRAASFTGSAVAEEVEAAMVELGDDAHWAAEELARQAAPLMGRLARILGRIPTANLPSELRGPPALDESSWWLDLLFDRRFKRWLAGEE